MNPIIPSGTSDAINPDLPAADRTPAALPAMTHARYMWEMHGVHVAEEGLPSTPSPKRPRLERLQIRVHKALNGVLQLLKGLV